MMRLYCNHLNIYLKNGGRKAASADTESTSHLSSSCSLQVEAQMPYPLSVAPRPLLQLAATLITKFSIQQLLPSFLTLLSTDYERWATGKNTSRTQAVGSLLTGTNTSSMGKVIDIKAE